MNATPSLSTAPTLQALDTPEPGQPAGRLQALLFPVVLLAALLAALFSATAAHAAPPTVAETARASQRTGAAAGNTDRDKARDEFLRTHRWNDNRNNWHVLRVAPRNVDAMSITQMQTEGSLLRQTHRWDGSAGKWLTRGNRPVPR